VKLGLLYVNVGPFACPDRFADLVQGAERQGFESLWAVDHAALPVDMRSVYPYTPDGRLPLPPTTDLADPLLALGYASALTRRIRLATGVLLVAQRHPAHVAKSLATLDRMSGGRAILGVGVGWLREEFELMGLSFRERARRTEECVRAVRSLWAEEPSEFEGEYFRWAPVHAHPRPGGGIPIVFGGGVEASARRAARLGDGFFPVQGEFAELRKLIAALREECEVIGRSADEIEISTVPISLEPEAIRAYRELGVRRLVVAPPAFERESLLAGLGDVRRRVAAALHAESRAARSNSLV